jgi:hypothetical protein
LVVRCGLGGPQLCRAWDGAAAVVDLDRQEMPLCVQPTPAQGVRVVAGVHAPRVYEIPWAAGRVAAKMAEWNAGWWRVICLEAPGTSSVATTHALELTVMAVGVDWFCSLLRSRREWARRWHPRRPSPVRRRLPRPPPTRCSRSAPRASVWQFPKDGMSSLHVSPRLVQAALQGCICALAVLGNAHASFTACGTIRPAGSHRRAKTPRLSSVPGSGV